MSDSDASMQIDTLEVEMDKMRAGDAQQAERLILSLSAPQRKAALLALLQSLSREEKAESVPDIIASFEPSAQFGTRESLLSTS